MRDLQLNALHLGVLLAGLAVLGFGGVFDGFHLFDEVLPLFDDGAPGIEGDGGLIAGGLDGVAVGREVPGGEVGIRRRERGREEGDLALHELRPAQPVGVGSFCRHGMLRVVG